MPTSTEFLLRPATQADVQSMLDIFNEAIINTTAVYYYEPNTLDMRQAWYDDKMKNDIPVLIAEVNGHVAGFASYGEFRTRPAYKYTVEHSVYVHPDFRKRGIARKLLEALIAIAKQKDIHLLVAGIDGENAVSIRLHEQLGFEHAGHIRQVAYKFGRWLDLVFMQLTLEGPPHPNELTP
ncbi:MAG TPA: GNAT family N-acetyltransferase [Chryseolinea sp.]